MISVPLPGLGVPMLIIASLRYASRRAMTDIYIEIIERSLSI